MEATLPLAGLEAPDEPFRGACPACGTEVLSVYVDGGEAVVDVEEVVPEFACPQCEQVAGRGHRRSECLRCGGARVVGEPLPLRGVAIDAAGEARSYSRRNGRAEGEAVHVFHVCEPVDDAV